MKLQSQSHQQHRNLVKQFKNMVLFVVLFLIVSLEVIESRFHVQTLPGFVGNLPITLETGYIGVGEADNEQWFYYFVESEGNPEKDPLVLWGAAGPSCSTLSILMGTIGPITFNKTIPTSEEAIFEINPYRLTKAANILYIDQPVGTGFSFAKNSESYITNDVLSTTKAYCFLKKWFVDHPKFLNNPFYLGGVSYNGILVPMIAHEIYNGNEAGEYPQINIKGYFIGNPLTDIHDDYNSRVTFVHRVALISDAIYESTKENCHGEYFNVDPNNTLCLHDLQVVFKCLERINKENILDPICDTLDTFKNSHLFRRSLASFKDNWLLPQSQAQPCSEDSSLLTAWANRRDVREALHVSEVYDKIKWERCNDSMVFDYRKKSKSYTYNIASSVAYHKHLTYSNCRALIYSGDHDTKVPYLGTLNWIKSLNLSLVNDWRPWFFDKQVAGYTMKYSARDYNLTFATVKGGGHQADSNKFKECSSMLTRWLSNNAL